VAVDERMLTEGDVEALKTIHSRDSLAVIAPKLVGVASVNRREAIIVGVDFPQEFRVKRWWRLRAGKEPANASRRALLGSKAAKRLGLRVGETARIKGEDFKVAGVLQPVGSQEDEPVYIDLKEAQTLLRRPAQLSMIEVSAWCIDCPIEQIVGQASEKLPHAKVSALRQATQARNEIVKQFTAFSVILSIVTAIVGGLIVFTNMLAAVRERRREIGIFRAIGFRRLNILEIILFETVIVALVAGLAGYLVGVSAAVIGAPGLGIDVAVGWDLNVGYFAILGSLLLALVSSLYPALTAANLSPLPAINDI